MRRAILIATLSCFVAAQTAAVRAQVDSDMAAARAANAQARSGVNATNAAGVVPGYTTTPPETRYYGRTDLGDAARTRLADCASTPADPVCQAQTGAVAWAAMPKPPMSPGDPDVAAATAIAGNPFGTAPGLAGYYNGCATLGACPANVFCLEGRCFDTAHVNDPDFAQAMTYLEAAREAGVYLDPATMTVFNGEDNRCRNRLLKNCCYADGAGAGFTNQSLFGIGSFLVFDILMNSGNRKFITQGFKALLTGNGFSGAFSASGVTIAVNGAPLPAGYTALATGEHVVVAFNPYALALAVVIYIAISMASCDAEEGKLAMKEGAGLCHTIGTWCSSCIMVLGSCVACIEHTTSKCCFNSKLARLINEQGRAQIGKAWGPAEAPDCTGMSVGQLQALDFSKMDLSEFYSSIVPTLPNLNTIRAGNTTRATSCYYGGGKC